MSVGRIGLFLIGSRHLYFYVQKGVIFQEMHFTETKNHDRIKLQMAKRGDNYGI